MRSLCTWLAVAILFLGGCRNIRYSSEEAVPRLEDVTEGETSYGAVLERFGAPILLAEIPGGFAMLYESIRIDEESLSVRMPGYGNYGTGSGARAYDSCILLFDDSGVLRQALRRGRGLSTGGGVQLGASGDAGFVGGKDYGAGASPFRWGMRGVNPLPILLNDRWSRIELGAGGFELADTPRDAGQHALARPVPAEDKEFR